MFRKLIALLTVPLVISLASKTAHAYLGGFENADGYSYAFTYPVLDNWVDVTNYNAGQWGSNVNAVLTPTPIPVNSGLWTYSSNPGSFFNTPTDRLTYMGGATPGSPPYFSSAVATPNTVASYVIGAHFGGRLGTNALALRNANNQGPIQYDYTLDSKDYGGVTPSTITSGTITTGFYFQPNPADGLITAPPGNGVFIPTKFIMSFTDSSGNVGLQWGYDRENNIQWRAGSTGPWIPTGLVGDSTQPDYDGVTVDLNLTSQTFKIDYYDLSANTTTTIAPAGTALGASMTDLTHLGWSLTDNLNSGVGGKNFFDDFSFSVPGTSSPEPTTALLLLTATPLLLKRRR